MIAQASARMGRLASSWRHVALNRNVISAAATVAAATFVLKLVTAGRELVVAHRFGTGDALDAFIIAMLAPSFVISVQVAAFSAALMPTVIRVSDQQGPAAARRLVQNSLVGVCLLLLALTALLYAAGEPIVRVLGSGFSAEKRSLTLELLRLLLPIIMLQGLVRFFATLLNARRRFGLVALVPLATPLLTVLLLVLAWRADPRLLVAGMVGGAALELALLMPLIRRLGLPVLPRWHGFDEATRTVVRQYLPTMLGALTGSAVAMVDQTMAAALEPGSVASLSYAGKISTLVLAFSAQPLSVAILPYLSRLAAARKSHQLRQAFFSWLVLVVVLSTPLAVALGLYSEDLVRLLFERGEFTRQDTILVGYLQMIYAMKMPFYLAGVLGSRFLNALSMNGVTGLIGVMNFVANIVGNLILMRFLGVAGIALSTVIVYALSSVVIVAVVHRRIARMCREPAEVGGAS
ncbi:murein biosynthesis integral membrane protein MurJ [Marinimicrococcus flavescens]|uniref:Lipid II flippase MurJ n=1 Tax=Marinimicrococcus flavescens TaxID=3031815 RepID=A0AAP3UYY6_9PROT|nr:lipid II flippase MurJ [Marinimicrococcus flavescens]